MTFSHRPKDGISVGFAIDNGSAFMAVGFVRDGDQFNRKLARRILAQRIMSHTTKGGPIRMVSYVPGVDPRLDPRAIVREFRKLFKPDPTCEDSLFMVGGSFEGISLITPMTRDEMYSKIQDMFRDAVKAASATCVS
jgi:hypothetical protein